MIRYDDGIAMSVAFTLSWRVAARSSLHYISITITFNMFDKRLCDIRRVSLCRWIVTDATGVSDAVLHVS